MGGKKKKLFQFRFPLLYGAAIFPGVRVSSPPSSLRTDPGPLALAHTFRPCCSFCSAATHTTYPELTCCNTSRRAQFFGACRRALTPSTFLRDTIYSFCHFTLFLLSRCHLQLTAIFATPFPALPL